MDCNDCLERLYAFLDKELSATELVEVQGHLGNCGHCADSFVFEERFLTKVRDCGTEESAPAELRERIVLRLRASGPPPA